MISKIPRFFRSLTLLSDFKKIILYRQGISFCFKKLENLSDNQKERLCLNGSKKIDARLF
ncbi:hypothetical protein PNK_1836 [Candidatus Protochlamydia naegleriophila]|uniref:Uncharacterized protein n=1 Tax=Candidatus Protochlamydia naegleriophila TaxID=389348 RepID=A0A0U5ET72_9BACT|nr:hypothetical protein PNK_1836 [Candidatus Protochlamydia naegleriophila]